MSGRWLAVVNPFAGGLRHGRLGGTFRNELSASVSGIAFTDGPGDATRIAGEARHYDGLVVVGGDGTVAEVLSGMDRSAQRLAVVPAGTGNCLARDLGIRNAEQALGAIHGGERAIIDLMETNLVHADSRITRHWLTSTAGLGYASEVAELAKRRFSKMRGAAYAIAATFVRPRPRMFTMSVNGSPPSPVSLTGLVVNNTRHIGNTLAFPAADLTDGILDALEFRAGWLKQLLHNLEMVARFPVPGTPSPRRLKAISIRSDTPETVMLDGELVGSVKEMTITCRPAAVTCMRVRPEEASSSRHA
jgi:diacylglycerol kinase (ATP)